MKKQFVTYEIALALKELGFNERCFSKWSKDWKKQSYSLYPILATMGLNSPYKKESNGYDQKEVNDGGYTFTGYKNNSLDHGEEVIAAPLWQQAIDWFIEEYNLLITITSQSQESWQWHIQFPHDSLNKMWEEDFYTYKEAREQAILKAIELCKKL